ncbi:PREDICTED: DDB1- and CUL4-associated factor 4 [Condylura cristata]|uniref:DDB1- and CUL4-associated factor 4 n=1 Tax=Condylura cristata TaxID=143302 RepID=UPI000643B614|nr:PREDICTED: DDB1- and CUL4-associated factor 4 [Condylura cristata]
MRKSSWQNRRRGRRSHPQTSRLRQQSSERHDAESQQCSPDSGPGNEEAPSTSSGAAGSSSAPDLPGYYFDPEKKRYFRLLPGHNNCNPLTRESIRHKEMESKRLAHELRVSCMQRQKVLIQSSDPSALASDRFNLILADTNSSRLFTVNDVKVGGSKYGIISLQGLKIPSLKVQMHENLYFTNRKVNSVCWASLNHLDSHILLCLMGIAETPGCATLLPASLFVSSHPAGDRPGMLCSFRIPGAWSCAWSLNVQANNCFSTGLSRRVLVTNVVTGQRQSFGTSSDVLTQQFALMTPLLFNGCRSGEIFAIDLRSRNQGKGWKASRLFHDSAVTSVQILQEEQCLMASDMAGAIKLWDLRTTKCIQQYEGHVNEYAYLPLHVHEEEGIVVAVGQDCYTRIWSLRDAHLLRTIPSPHPTSKADIPSVAFSSRLGGLQGAPGLLMAVQQDLYCFSYN